MNLLVQLFGEAVQAFKVVCSSC